METLFLIDSIPIVTAVSGARQERLIAIRMAITWSFPDKLLPCQGYHANDANEWARNNGMVSMGTTLEKPSLTGRTGTVAVKEMYTVALEERTIKIRGIRTGCMREYH